MVAKERHIVVYDAKCSNSLCSWSRTGVTREQLEADIAEHLIYACNVADAWQNVDPEEAYLDV